jgi:translocation and assembly module TamB
MVAGIQVTGNVQAPIISLYSRPAMSDADILSYMLVGKAATSDGVQTGLLMKAANSLFSRGQSAPTLEQLKKSLGLEDLEVETNQIGTEKAMVSVGKYLGPGLYASFGRSLFNSDYIISIRYSLTKNWEIRTTAGPQSGGDIYYKMEFD